MKTIRVIDLLNKIANGEDIPERIKYDEKIYNYSKYSEWYFTDDMLYKLFIDKNKFNEEVEIIEDTSKEDKKIEKLIKIDAEQFFNKVNEIIDRLNGEE